MRSSVFSSCRGFPCWWFRQSLDLRRSAASSGGRQQRRTGAASARLQQHRRSSTPRPCQRRCVRRRGCRPCLRICPRARSPSALPARPGIRRQAPCCAGPLSYSQHAALIASKFHWSTAFCLPAADSNACDLWPMPAAHSRMCMHNKVRCTYERIRVNQPAITSTGTGAAPRAAAAGAGAGAHAAGVRLPGSARAQAPAFRAAPAPRHPPPRAPRPSDRPLTAAHTPNLALETRSAARAVFDAGVAERQRQHAVCKSGSYLLTHSLDAVLLTACAPNFVMLQVLHSPLAR